MTPRPNGPTGGKLRCPTTRKVDECRSGIGAQASRRSSVDPENDLQRRKRKKMEVYLDFIQPVVFLSEIARVPVLSFNSRQAAGNPSN